jgi:hypothetical protein
MMPTTTNSILILQAALVFVQIVNAGLATEPGIHVPRLVVLIVVAFTGALQFYVNHVGNQITPGTTGPEGEKKAG